MIKSRIQSIKIENIESASKIYENMGGTIDSSSSEDENPVEDNSFVNSEFERERDFQVERKIHHWKQSAEFKRLGPKARTIVETSMREKDKRYSETYLFLTQLADRASILWEDTRVPFYQRIFLEKKAMKKMEQI